MDEIITRWATDLTKYQKDFREQAEKVAEWDQLLVENGNKVQKVYGETVEAERATREVERQLSAVERNQDEVENWLANYEKKVDELLAKQTGPNDNLMGPDAEREKTYKTAEKISDRLDAMGRGLTEMIEEVNTTSATLSKTNRVDEPVSSFDETSFIVQCIDNCRRSLRLSASSTRIWPNYRSSTRVPPSCKPRLPMRSRRDSRSPRAWDTA